MLLCTKLIYMRQGKSYKGDRRAGYQVFQLCRRGMKRVFYLLPEGELEMYGESPIIEEWRLSQSPFFSGPF
jgi:hypothetical protein